MTLHLLFVILVVLGFGFQLLATWPVQYANRISWSLWFAASVIWAIGQ